MIVPHESSSFSKLFKIFLGLLVFGLFCSHAIAATPSSTPVPDIAAKSWVLMDHDSGRLLVEKNPDTPVPPASLTKLMTAYVLFGKIKNGKLRPDDTVHISKKASMAKGARLFLRPGTKARVDELLQGMIVLSANDAAIALAEQASGSEAGFVAEMNDAANSLSLTLSRFENVTGHDQQRHAASGRDLAHLASAMIRDFPEQYRLFAVKEFTYLGITQYNHNALLWRDRSIDGVKTGQTRKAGYCILASSVRDGMRLIAVVLGAQSETARFEAAQKLLDHGYRYFETRLIQSADIPAVRVRVWLGDEPTVPIGVAQNLYLTLPRGWHDKLQARLILKETPYAPVRAGETVGTLALELNQEPYAEYPLVALKEIKKGNLFQRAIDKFQLWLK